jgi:hypothetical protein
MIGPNTPIPSTARRSGKIIYGILGTISLSLCQFNFRSLCPLLYPLSSAEYVVILTGRELRGRLMGHEVYRTTDFDILPLNPNASVLNPPHIVEGHLLALVQSHLNSGQFLFSYEWDVTRRLQAQWETMDKDQGRHWWETVCMSILSILYTYVLKADDRFFWNKCVF